MDLVRQPYLEGFEGGDLPPARARMAEAYVNGVDGQAADNLAVCLIGGYKPRDEDSARKLISKVFTAPGTAEAYRAEREYVRWLQARNTVQSAWSAEEIQRRLRMNVLLAQGEMPFDKLLVAAHKGAITTKQVRTTEVNIPAATTALHLLGKTMGMFADSLALTGANGGALEMNLVRRVQYVPVGDDEGDDLGG